MKRISNTLFLPLFSLVSATSSYAAISSSSASLVDTSQNQTFESGPTHSFKLAAVHFITNDNALNFGNQEFLLSDLCKQGGYIHEDCPSGYVKGEPCSYDNKFVKDCIAPDTWRKNNGYNVTSCSVPKYPVNQCLYKSSLYKSCETDNIRACKEAGYSLTCEAGKVGGDSCPYNSSYKKCICNPCSGFDYTATQASAQGYVPGEVCNSCGTIKYKRSENACAGYKACDCGGESGAKVCYSGLVQKFDTCKSCCDSKYQYDSSNCTGGKVLAGSSCGGKYEKCRNPQVGDIYYHDGTISDIVLNNKTPIGVVVIMNSDNISGIITALDESYATWSTTLDNAPGDAGWSSNSEDINNGKKATYKIYEYYNRDNSKAPAVAYTTNYMTAGTSKGDWYLGSISLFSNMRYSFSTVNQTLAKIGGAPLSGGYWSSGINDNNYAYACTPSSGTFNLESKQSRSKVRAFLSFDGNKICSYKYIYNNSNCGNRYQAVNGEKCGIEYTQCLQAGDFVYADKSTSSELISGKTPIGVVYNPTLRLMSAIIPAESKKWTTSTEDIPALTNIASSNGYLLMSTDMDGKANTTAILNYYGKEASEKAPAAYYAANYSTPGTNKGDWFLPSLGQALSAKNYLQSTIDQTYFNLGLLQLTNRNMWTSSEENANKAYFLEWNGSSKGSSGNKDWTLGVVPMTNF